MVTKKAVLASIAGFALALAACTPQAQPAKTNASRPVWEHPVLEQAALPPWFLLPTYLPEGMRPVSYRLGDQPFVYFEGDEKRLQVQQWSPVRRRVSGQPRYNQFEAGRCQGDWYDAIATEGFSDPMIIIGGGMYGLQC